MLEPYSRRNPTQNELREAKNRSPRRTAGININSWNCPACNRSVEGITRWHKNGYWGYTIVEHHDHSPLKRFANILICEHCNSVDSKVKVKRKKELTQFNWSFSVDEIKEIITPHDHRKHIIDTWKGLEIANNIIYDINNT